MALLNLLRNQGSVLSRLNGGSAPYQELATKQSKMHGENVKEGYSVDSSFANIVNTFFRRYDDGVNNSLPVESRLDLTNNITNATKYKFTHKWLPKPGKGYRNNLPEGVSR